MISAPIACQIRSNYWPTPRFALVLRDMPRERVAFHVESGDYFGTLATVVGLVADVVAGEDAGARKRCEETLLEVREDLVYLQENCTIVRKEGPAS